MAKKKKKMRLASGEIEILEMLWRENIVTIAEAHAAIGRPIGYTTVQTRLNRLVEKGIVKKKSCRPAQYEAVVFPEDVNREDLDVLVKQVNKGRIVPLVAHLVKDRSLSAGELKQLKQLIAEAERNNQTRSSSKGEKR